jgi:hypothetical protein
LLPALASLASAAVLEARQAKGFSFGRALKSAFVEKLEPSIKDRKGVIRQLVGFGPIPLVSVAGELTVSPVPSLTRKTGSWQAIIGFL